MKVRLHDVTFGLRRLSVDNASGRVGSRMAKLICVGIWRYVGRTFTWLLVLPLVLAVSPRFPLTRNFPARMALSSSGWRRTGCNFKAEELHDIYTNYPLKMFPPSTRTWVLTR